MLCQTTDTHAHILFAQNRFRGVMQLWGRQHLGHAAYQIKHYGERHRMFFQNEAAIYNGRWYSRVFEIKVSVTSKASSIRIPGQNPHLPKC